MKKNLILVLFIALNTGLYAQTNTPSTSSDAGSTTQSCGFLHVFGGVVIPSGNWTHTSYIYDTQNGNAWESSNPDNLSAGFAGNGSIFGFEGAWYFCKYLGIGGQVSYTHLAFKGLDSISAGYQSSFDVDQVTTYVTGGWDLWNFSGGLYFRYPITDKFWVTAKALGGLTSATTPQIAVDLYDGGIDDHIFTQQRCTANSFAYIVGIGLSYNVLSYMSVNLQGNYFSSQPDFLIDNTNRNVLAGRYLAEYNQPLTGMNFTLGVSYLIGTK